MLMTVRIAMYQTNVPVGIIAATIAYQGSSVHTFCTLLSNYENQFRKAEFIHRFFEQLLASESVITPKLI